MRLDQEFRAAYPPGIKCLIAMAVKPRAMMVPLLPVTPDLHRVTLPLRLEVSACVYRHSRTARRIANEIGHFSQLYCLGMSGAVVTCPARLPYA